MTRPPASAIGTSSDGSGRVAARTRPCASSKVSSEATLGAYRSRDDARGYGLEVAGAVELDGVSGGAGR